MTATISLGMATVALPGGTVSSGERTVPLETPVAFEFNGIAYAVMMASPIDLHDFTVGFALAEGLVSRADELADIDICEVERGMIVRANLPPDRAEPLIDRVRLRVTEGSCGLCGLQSIDDALRPLPPVTARPAATIEGIATALDALGKHQPLARQTGATHAAAFCGADGAIIAAREDVGRHNALDKLIGHLARAGMNPADGFILLSSRGSYELVEKTVRAGCPMLVTISAPTALAVTRAKEAGLTLLALARRDSALIANDPHRLFA